MLSTLTTVGSIGILANHAPLLARLEPTELRLYRTEDEIVRFAQAEGYLQFADNHALVLVEEAIAPGASTASLREQALRSARCRRARRQRTARSGRALARHPPLRGLPRGRA